MGGEKEWLKYSDKGLINIIAGTIAVGLTALTITIVMVILFLPIPPQNETLVGQAFGTVLSLMGVIVAFFYGSSTSSRRDSETINTLAGMHERKSKIVVAPGETVTVQGERTNEH